MDKITSSFSINRLFLISFLLLCSFFISENVFSRDHWVERFMNVTCDGQSIVMKNKVIDYYFGPGNETAYLEVCDYEYSTDGVNFFPLMRCDVRDQDVKDWTWMTLRFKKFGAKIDFINTAVPAGGSLWSDADTAPEVRVMNEKTENYNYFQHTRINGYLTVKWTPAPEDGEINFIRIHGFWKLNGAYGGDPFDVIYTVYRQGPPVFVKSTVTTVSENNTVKISKISDAIVVKGAELGENIQVYNLLGEVVKSAVANSDAVNIRLAKNQIYIVKVGQSSYKVTL